MESFPNFLIPLFAKLQKFLKSRWIFGALDKPLAL